MTGATARVLPFPRPTPAIERIVLRRVSAHRAFAEVRLESVNLRCLQVTRQADGAVSLVAPKILSTSGRDFGRAYGIEPAVRTKIELALAAAWRQAEAADGP
jgi:hypothetical protein